MEQQEQQYYDATQTGEPVAVAPVARRRFNPTVLIGVGIVVVLAVIVWLVWPSSGERQQARVQESVLETAQRACAMDDDQETCLNQYLIDAAQDAQDVDICLDIEHERAKENCVTLVARRAIDAELCTALKRQKDDCMDAVNYRVAIDGTSVQACDVLKDEETKANCVASLEAAAVREDACESYGVDVALCDVEAAIDALIAAQNAAGCRQLADDAAGDCLDRMHGLDQDGDGLSLYEESELGTNDLAEDTDGDGYSDPVEVENGFDPLS